jgi:hypothetical protein
MAAVSNKEVSPQGNADGQAVLSGRHSAWLKKMKSDNAKAKWFSNSTKRHFTIDFDMKSFYYSHSEDQKKISQPIPFRDFQGAERLPAPVRAVKKRVSGCQSTGFVFRTTGRTFELHTLGGSSSSGNGTEAATSFWDAAKWVYMLNAAKDSAAGIGSRLQASAPTLKDKSGMNSCSTPMTMSQQKGADPKLSMTPLSALETTADSMASLGVLDSTGLSTEQAASRLPASVATSGEPTAAAAQAELHTCEVSEPELQPASGITIVPPQAGAEEELGISNLSAAIAPSPSQRRLNPEACDEAGQADPTRERSEDLVKASPDSDAKVDKVVDKQPPTSEELVKATGETQLAVSAPEEESKVTPEQQQVAVFPEAAAAQMLPVSGEVAAKVVDEERVAEPPRAAEESIPGSDEEVKAPAERQPAGHPKDKYQSAPLTCALPAEGCSPDPEVRLTRTGVRRLPKIAGHVARSPRLNAAADAQGGEKTPASVVMTSLETEPQQEGACPIMHQRRKEQNEGLATTEQQVGPSPRDDDSDKAASHTEAEGDQVAQQVRVPEGPVPGTHASAALSGWDEADANPAQRECIPEGPVPEMQQGAVPSGWDEDEKTPGKAACIPEGPVPEMQQGAAPSGWDDDEDTPGEPACIPEGPVPEMQKSAAASGWDEAEADAKPLQRACIPEGPVLGTQEGAAPSGWDSDEGEQPQSQKVQKGGIALEFDMGAGSGPCKKKKAPKALADRLSKRRPLKPLKQKPPAPDSGPLGLQGVNALSGSELQSNTLIAETAAVPNPTPVDLGSGKSSGGAPVSASDLLTEALVGQRRLPA